MCVYVCTYVCMFVTYNESVVQVHLCETDGIPEYNATSSFHKRQVIVKSLRRGCGEQNKWVEKDKLQYKNEKINVLHRERHVFGCRQLSCPLSRITSRVDLCQKSKSVKRVHVAFMNFQNIPDSRKQCVVDRKNNTFSLVVTRYSPIPYTVKCHRRVVFPSHRVHDDVFLRSEKMSRVKHRRCNSVGQTMSWRRFPRIRSRVSAASPVTNIQKYAFSAAVFSDSNRKLWNSTARFLLYLPISYRHNKWYIDNT